MTGKDIGEKMLDAVKSFVSGAIARVQGEWQEKFLALEKRLNEIPSGEKGEKGERGDPGERGAAGENGRDGEPGARGERGEKGEPGERGESGINGKDGQDGLDALEIDILSEIDPEKRYPRRSYASHNGGLWRAYENTEGMSGWECIVNGIHEEKEETLDEGRAIRRTTVYSNGKEFVREIKTSTMIYRGVWRDGEFERGDIVTWDGSSWHCEEPTTDKPGTSKSWKLMTKRGKDGKDAAPIPGHKVISLK